MQINRRFERDSTLIQRDFGVKSPHPLNPVDEKVSDMCPV